MRILGQEHYQKHPQVPSVQEQCRKLKKIHEDVNRWLETVVFSPQVWPRSSAALEQTKELGACRSHSCCQVSPLPAQGRARLQGDARTWPAGTGSVLWFAGRLGFVFLADSDPAALGNTDRVCDLA